MRNDRVQSELIRRQNTARRFLPQHYDVHVINQTTEFPGDVMFSALCVCTPPLCQHSGLIEINEVGLVVSQANANVGLNTALVSLSNALKPDSPTN